MTIHRGNHKDKTEPSFIHDCSRCIFLGNVKTNQQGYGDSWDLWWCPKVSVPGAANSSSVICRYGNDGHEYSSSLPPECFASPLESIDLFKKHERPYIFAMARAAKLGLYNGPYKEYFTDAG